MHESARALDKEWLWRCPRTAEIIHDNGSEFAAEILELLASYRIKMVRITEENNRQIIVERTHKTFGDMIKTEDFTDAENPMRDADVLL